MTLSILCYTYNMIGARELFYHDERPVSLRATSFSFGVLYILFVEITIYLLMVHIGFKYLDAGVPKESNEELLNNLKEGLIITDEKSAEVHF